MKRIWMGLIFLFASPWAYAQDKGGLHTIPYKVSELNTSIFKFLYEWFAGAYAVIWEGVVSLADFAETADWIYHSFSQPQIRAQIIEFSIELSASLLIAFALERLLTLYLTPIGKKYRNMVGWQHFWRDVIFVSICLIPVTTFGFSFYISFRLLEPVGVVYLQIATIFINGISGAWAFIRTSKLVLTPRELKSHLPFSRDVLQSTHRWLRRIAGVILTGYFIEEAGHLIGLPAAGHKLVLQITTFIILTFSLTLVWGLHNEFTRWLYGSRKKKDILPWKRRFLAFMHFSPLLFVYLMVVSYMTWVLPFNEDLLVAWKALATTLLFPLLFYGQHLIGKLQRYWIDDHLIQFAPELGERAQFYERQIGFVLGSALTILLILFTIWFWGGNPFIFINTEAGQQIAEKALSFIIIIGSALFLLRAGKGVINHYLDPKGIRGITPGERARMKTLHSIILNVLQILVWVPALLLILAELDIDILPAAAIIGVLGVGLSLGVQSIIADFVTGLFMLIENTFAVGDVIEVNGKLGAVESLTVRVLRLRAMDGTISSYPYGKIEKISNYSRQYSVAILFISVGREEDLEKISKMIVDLDEHLRKDNEQVKTLVIEPIIIDGVTETTDIAITIRVRVKTKPKGHWSIKHLYAKEITTLLDKKGVKQGLPTQRIICDKILPKKK